VGPKASGSTGKLEFTAAAGTTSASKSVTLSNSGDAELKVSQIQTSDGSVFPIDGGCAGAKLAPSSGSCKVGVKFKPAAAQAYSGTLTISTDGGSVKVSLKGTGTTAAATPVPLPAPGVHAPATGDRDGDGVADAVDKCPTVAGVLLNGCPLDRDGDGVLDTADACPTTPGTMTNGCPSDLDHDGVPDGEDHCLHAPGDLKNGCPSELNASVRGRWRVNGLYSQLLSLSVLTTSGSRIEVHCSRRNVCGFKKRTILSTKRRITGLTKYFKHHTVLPAHVRIVVIVTRRNQIGTYESLTTRAGRHLPRVTLRCVTGRKSDTITSCF
jgi:hypothetical protein